MALTYLTGLCVVDGRFDESDSSECVVCMVSAGILILSVDGLQSFVVLS